MVPGKLNLFAQASRQEFISFFDIKLQDLINLKGLRSLACISRLGGA